MIRIEGDQTWYDIFHSIDSLVYNDHTQLLVDYFLLDLITFWNKLNGSFIMGKLCFNILKRCIILSENGVILNPTCYQLAFASRINVFQQMKISAWKFFINIQLVLFYWKLWNVLPIYRHSNMALCSTMKPCLITSFLFSTVNWDGVSW
jgi:hypothetical protein